MASASTFTLASEGSDRTVKVNANKVLPVQYWSVEDYTKAGLKIDAALTIRAVELMLPLFASGDTQAKKAYLTICPDDLFSQDKYASLAPDYTTSPPDARFGALVGFVGDYAGVKVLHSNPLNYVDDRARQNSVITVMHKYTGALLGMMNSKEISDARTALYVYWVYLAYMSKIIDQISSSKEPGADLEVFIFGAGDVAERIIHLLDHAVADKISRVTVCTRSNSGARMITKIKSEVTPKFLLEATTNKDRLKAARIVVTVTSNTKKDKPVIEHRSELHPKVKLISLDTNGQGQDVINWFLEKGEVLVDTIDNVSDRGAQALAMFFAAKDTTLKQEAAKHHVKELADLEPCYEDKPVLGAFSGHAGIDVAVAVGAFSTLAGVMGKVLPF